MGQIHGCSLHPSYWYLKLCASGRDRDSHLLGFYLILISELEHIRYLITSSTDVRNISTVISSFGDIVKKCFTQSSVTCNLMCEMRSCRMCTWI